MIYSPDEYSFLRAIADEPENDLPRLVYADWLEDRGNPRGEFIRILCELARLPANAPERPALEAREDDLRRNWRRLWAQPFFDAGVSELWFHRGVVDTIELLGEAFLYAPGAIADLLPVVRVVHVYYFETNSRRGGYAIARSPADVQTLRLKLPAASAGQLADFVTLAPLPNLHEFELIVDRSAATPGPDGNEGRETSDGTDRSSLPALEKMQLTGMNPAIPDLVRVELPALTQLTLVDESLDDNQALQLCEPWLIKNLRLLDIHARSIPASAVQALEYHFGSRLTIQSN